MCIVRPVEIISLLLLMLSAITLWTTRQHLGKRPGYRLLRPVMTLLLAASVLVLLPLFLHLALWLALRHGWY